MLSHFETILKNFLFRKSYGYYLFHHHIPGTIKESSSRDYMEIVTSKGTYKRRLQV